MGAFFTLSTSFVVILLVIPGGLCVDIIGGNEVAPHSRPFMALIRGKKDAKICGGALIKENWVLTAAHCNIMRQLTDIKEKIPPDRRKMFRDPYFTEYLKDGIVILGAHSWQKREHEQQVHQIAKQIPYPCYSDSKKENDIMLLQLKKRAKLNKAVKIIPLPNSDDDPKAGTSCKVAGWGKTHNNLKKSSSTLREVNITVIDRRICNDWKHYNSNPVITENMICAGSRRGGKDSCSGDSGGPLICNNVMRGITSFGKANKCGAVDSPGVYTRLTKQYLLWIRKTIGGDLQAGF